MEPLTRAEFQRAAERISPGAVRTPLIKLNVDPSSEVAGGAEIYLKVETLQPVRSFKLRGALNALRAASPAAHIAYRRQAGLAADFTAAVG